MNAKKHSVGTLVAMLLACIFAICVLLTLVFGVRAYRTVAQDAEQGYSRSVGLSYVTQKVRAYDQNGLVSAGAFEGLDALHFYEVFDGVTYETLLYVYDGWLCELYAEQGAGFLPEDGETLLEAQGMTVSQEGTLLMIGFTGIDGKTSYGTIALRSEGGAS